MKGWQAAALLITAACGDDLVPVGPSLEHADTMFFVAHSDDDMIFMQPELLDALQGGGSVATVYFVLGDPDKGWWHAQDMLKASRTAYAGIVGSSSDWDCGYIALTFPVEHCRLRGREVSLIAVDLSDGRIPGDRRESLLHLVDGTITSMPLISPAGGVATRESVLDVASDLLTAITPAEVHALELAGTHGRDHSSHMFASSFLFWAAARFGYAGPMTWHRGYNVADEPVTLDGAEYGVAAHMLGYYEACANSCGSCGSPCATISTAHETWLHRQYALHRSDPAAGRLATDTGCVTSEFSLGDCAAAPAVALTGDGHVHLGTSCLASQDDGTVTSAPCAATPEQYWVLDSESTLWNGRPPVSGGDMTYDHVRCLAASDGVLSAPTCGAHATYAWQVTE